MLNEQEKKHGENKRSHLQMIQGIINRMGGNLFFLKGWAVTLIVALFTASISFTENMYLQLTLAGVIVFFWCFDAYFLALERCYRDLYDIVRSKNEIDVDFSMDVSDLKKYAKNTWVGAMLSTTLLAFYPLLGSVMLLIINFI